MAAPTNLKVNSEVSDQIKAFGVPLISVTAVVLLVIFAIFPLWEKVSAKQTELTDRRKVLEALTTKENDLNKLDTSKITDQFQHAEAALPSGKEVPSLLVGLSRLYQDQGLQLTALKLTPGNVASEEATLNDGTKSTNASPVVGGNVGIGNQIFPKDKRLDFDLVLSGTVEQARGFLKTLEKSVRLMVVNSFTFASSKTAAPTISLKITAPFDPAPPLPTDFSVPLPALTADDEKYLNLVSTYTPLTTPFTNSFTGNSSGNPFGSQLSVPTVTGTPLPTISTTPVKPATTSALPR